ncbi:hypothetical protein AB0B12_33970 [Streptomyces sp. NPDC044780]|uniref:Uncharacterized protein n=1 Tax=Streptomyces luomodiensis TaxID=3026192 RepID=A0ABY9V2U5_9ACTN|nr:MULTISPECIES: hypothetical protein [unclassified Streptomyces]WAP57414.1 hypothetical protein N6H00_22045 [Streptomyces sp. S465]WNE97983.1 hypothetical protein PS467_22980 [Streptomyces sp. SCA4-21]
MLRKMESLGQALLERFVPKISASAQVSSPQQCWSQCWQCNKAYGYGNVNTWCSYNAPCCGSSGVYTCYC